MSSASMLTVPRRRAALVLLVLSAVALGWWWWRAPAESPKAGKPAARAPVGLRGGPPRRFVDGRWQVGAPRVAGASAARSPIAGLLRVTGTVREMWTGAPTGGVEVVFSTPSGEATAIAGADGGYVIDVAPGVYLTYVRGDDVLSVGEPGVSRVPVAPSLRAVGAPSDDLATRLGVYRDLAGIDLEVGRKAIIEGVVVDRAGLPIAGALVRSRHVQVRPVLGTDVAETEADGRFHLEVAAGAQSLDAAHARYAGVEDGELVIDAPASKTTKVHLTMVAGCVLRGVVVDADGAPVDAGVIEQRFGEADDSFTLVSEVADDGTFRFATAEEGDVELRGWPWKSPPSPAQRFACRDGVHRDDVVFQVPRAAADVEGVIVDAHGAPVPGAFIDIIAEDDGGMNQQERADAEGRWAVYALPAATYMITAYTADGGVVSQRITAPARGVRLQLGGTGTLEGVVDGLVDGSFVLTIVECQVVSTTYNVNTSGTPSRRLVTVARGHYRLDGVPACALRASATASGRRTWVDAEVQAGAVTTLDLDLRRSRTVVMTGRIVDEASGAPIAGAVVRTEADDEHGAGERPNGGSRVVTGADGRYRVEAQQGDIMVVEADDHGTAWDQVPWDEPAVVDVALSKAEDIAFDEAELDDVEHPARDGDGDDDVEPLPTPY